MEECKCDHCDQNPASHVCGSCQAVAYCGKSCQSAHWVQEHEAVCFNVNQPNMTHLTSLIGAEASKDDLMAQVHEALIESPNDPELQEIAVYLGQYLVGETAAEKYQRYMEKKGKGAKVSTKKGWKGKLQNFYNKGKYKFDKWNLKRQTKNKMWKEQKQSYVPPRDDMPPMPMKNKLYF
jgi:hypothetical protein